MDTNKIIEEKIKKNMIKIYVQSYYNDSIIKINSNTFDTITIELDERTKNVIQDRKSVV